MSNELKVISRRVILLGLALWLAGADRVAAQSRDEQALLQVERDWEQVNAKNDVTALERILAPEFINTNADGEMVARADVIARRKSGAVKMTAFTQDDYKVRVFGDTAVVTGRSTSKGTFNGKDVSGQERFTDVFVRRDGRWQAVASQSTRVVTP